MQSLTQITLLLNKSIEEVISMDTALTVVLWVVGGAVALYLLGMLAIFIFGAKVIKDEITYHRKRDK